MAKKPTGSKQAPTAQPGAADLSTTASGRVGSTSPAADAKPPSAAADASKVSSRPATDDKPLASSKGTDTTVAPSATKTVAETPEASGESSSKDRPPDSATKTSQASGSRKSAVVTKKAAPPRSTSPASDATRTQPPAPPEEKPAVVAKLAQPESIPVVSSAEDPPMVAVELPDDAPAPEPVAAEAPAPEPIVAEMPVEVPPMPAIPELPPEPQRPPEPPPFTPPSRRSLFIVHITPELATVAKVGGLADVVFGLTRELAIRGNHVEIILPKYDSLRYDQIYELHEVYKDLWVPWYEGAIHCTVLFGFVHGRKCFFIEPHSRDNFFNRGAIYGFHDDVLRYAFFSRAAMEFLWQSGKHPDVIHCHDWQTALIPVFLYEFYQPLGMTHPRICLTIHNFAHQGVTGSDLLRATGLHRPERFLDQTRMGDQRHPSALNLLKGGIVYSNFVTTVSPRYAFETKDQGQGFGLESTLHTHHIKYGGVVNGIDYDVWNPEVDHQIPAQYGIDTIERKYDNKRALRHRLMLADNGKAIVAFIGRLDPQKGLELVRHAIFYCLERGAQFVLLGSSPDQRINNDFWGLKRMLNDSPDCHLEIGFDEDLSHLIYAGADMMLVPSRFEPCGLTQLISLRYGTIPVVRAIGGLADTVFDKDHSNRPLHERNGYTFQDYDNRGLESALGRAIACYNNHPEHFRDLMRNAMRSDYSWNIPGQDYLNIYDYIRDT
jgi:starch synthase